MAALLYAAVLGGGCSLAQQTHDMIWNARTCRSKLSVDCAPA